MPEGPFCQIRAHMSKVMIFRKGGILPRNLKFYYNDEELEIVNTSSYLGIIFSPGGSFFKYTNYTCRSSSKGDI